MKTVLITGDAPAPAPLRELVERGSTSLLERRAAELAGAVTIEADRIVFWSAADEPDIRRLAEQYAQAEAAERQEALVFVTAATGGTPPPDRLSPNEVFVWPRDEDRLRMAFLTGA
ncbi:MAG: hypothetical protein ACRD15_01255 [Vicinamibacterales bacterium]